MRSGPSLTGAGFSVFKPRAASKRRGRMRTSLFIGVRLGVGKCREEDQGSALEGGFVGKNAGAGDVR